MTIIVTGAGGMLGQAVVQAAKAAGHDVVGYTRTDLDVTDERAIAAGLDRYDTPSVINCAGVVRGRHTAWTPDATLVNAQAPHKLAKWCDRLVQVSTDCVFSGHLGPGGAIPTYNELSPTSPTDWYGETKLAGEVHADPHVTVRGSFIGFDSGLLAWFVAQPQGATVPGYVDHGWSGGYVVDYADRLVAIALATEVTGIVHLVGPRTTKAKLLQHLRFWLRPDIHVDEVLAPSGPRYLSLRSTRAGVPSLPSWDYAVLERMDLAQTERTTA